MSDNLFERLFELFQSPGPVNWKLAEELLGTVVGEGEPIDPDLADEYIELGRMAELRLGAADDIPTPPAAPINPVDRRTWARENVQAFRFLLEPLSERLSFGSELGEDSPFAAALAPLGPAILGMQAGSMIGSLAQRVLGQFDTGVPALDHDRRYLIVPNVEDFATGQGLDVRQVRLWAALHEVAYHAVINVPWVRGHFVKLVDAFFATVSFEPDAAAFSLEDLQDPMKLQEALGGAGTLSKFLGEKHDPERFDAIRAFVAFLEGYGDYVVRREGAALLPDLDRIEAAYTTRRAEPDEASQALEQLLGLGLERHRAADAAGFCAEVARRWGPETLAGIWQDPAKLPTLSELTDPVGWAARLLA